MDVKDMNNPVDTAAETVAETSPEKKKSNKYVYICIAAAVAFLAAVVIYTNLPKSDDTYLGNSISNIVNGGYVVRDEDNKTTYYSAYSIYGKKDDGEDYKISEDYANAMLLYDGKLYYSNFGDLHRPYVIDTAENSTGNCLNSDAYVDCMCIYKDKIYYCCNTMMDEEGIYSMNLDGSGKELIVDTIADCVYVFRNNLYYINKEDKNTLYRISLEDGSILKMTGTYTFTPVMDTDTGDVYYGNRFGVFSLDFDGKDQKQYSEELTTALAFDDDGNLYSVVDDELGSSYNGLYRVDKDKLTQIAGGDMTWISVAGDKIYFKSTENEGFNTVRCNLDGSEMELVQSTLYE